MKFLRPLLLLGVIGTIVYVFYWARFTPKEDLSQRIYQTIKEQQQRADLSFKQVVFEEINNGTKYWQLASDSAMVNKDTGLATLKDASGTFFKQGIRALCFRSPAALWDMKKKEIYLDKPLGFDASLEKKVNSLAIVRRNGSRSVFNFPDLYRGGLGYWFQASNLSWKLADQQLFCSGGIELNKGELSGFAQQLFGDVGLENILLEGTPRIVIRDPKGPPVTVEATTFELRNAENTMLARGETTIHWGEAVIVSDRAVYRQKIRTLELSGNVRVNYRDITASGQRASYQTESQLLSLKGEATAQQGENRLTGDQVTVSLRDQKISLAGRGKVVITEEELK